MTPHNVRMVILEPANTTKGTLQKWLRESGGEGFTAGGWEDAPWKQPRTTWSQPSEMALRLPTSRREQISIVLTPSIVNFLQQETKI